MCFVVGVNHLGRRKVLESVALRRAFRVSEHARAACFVSAGTVSKSRPVRGNWPTSTRIMSAFGA